MGKRPTASTLKRGPGRVKRIVLFFLKAIYLSPFVVFGLWLIGIVYFQGYDFKRPFSSRPEKKEEKVLKVFLHKQETVPRQHFHMVDQYVEAPTETQAVCVVCHGSYAHSKEKKTRAILNMHEGFISCYVCHSRQEHGQGKVKTTPSGARIKFLWVDSETGEFKNAVKGEYGKYPAQIFPIEYSEGEDGRIFTPIKLEAAQAFLNLLPELTPDQVSSAKAKLHEPLSKEPVSCADCHKKDGYLDFKSLGFPQQRIDHLISTEFVGMFEKYKTFYLPSVLDFRGN